jgi:4-hydroxy-3-methylbut-2-enyl diphosphate reductase
VKVILANPRGFCAGVDRAIEIVEKALDVYDPPIYVRHEVVHNRFVVQRLRERGAIFVDELSEVPDGQTVIFSAHGVSQTVRAEAEQRGFNVLDATCPLVTKVHLEVARHCRDGFTVLLIGHKGHPEVEGTMGQYRCDGKSGHALLVESVKDVAQLDIPDDHPVAFVTQTTLSMDDTAQIIDALQARFPHIKGPRKNDICYATQNRQDAVKALAARCDAILVVGSRNSSNSNRLRELGEKHGTPSYLIDGASDIDPAWLSGVEVVGVTAGASAPEVLVNGVVDRLKALGAASIEESDGVQENVTFVLPKPLQNLVAEAEKASS